MPSEIYEIGDLEAADIQSVNVPGGEAIRKHQQSIRPVSPAASNSDDHSRIATQTSSVVRSGRATKNRRQPTSALSPAADFSDDLAPGGTHSEPVVIRGRGHPRFDTHTPHASSSKNRKGLTALVGEADHNNRDIHDPRVGFPTILPDDHKVHETHRPDVVGGKASHSSIETLRESAGLSTTLPLDDQIIRGPQSSTVVGGEASHQASDTHPAVAGFSTSISDDHYERETRIRPVVGNGEASHSAVDTQSRSAGLSVLIEEIREQWRRRQIWHRAEKSLTLQAKACCRRLVEGDKIKAAALFKSAYGKCDNELAEVAFAATFPLVEAGKSVETHRKAVEKRLLKLAAQLPIADFILSLRGVGLLSLAGIIGEAGDLSVYNGPAKLWKRMGVGIVDGGRQRRVCDAEAALKHGYSPARRSHMWNIGSCIIKAGGPLKDLYVERKEYELTKPETASKLHAHRKAQRYVEKRLLREMWCEWRKH